MVQTRSVKRRRAGRNRKGGARHNCDKLVQPPERNSVNTSTVFETRCRQDDLNPKTADRKEILDPFRGYVLGRLFLSEAVSEVECDAGRKYETDYRRWVNTNGMARITAPAGSYGQSVPGQDEVPDDVAKAAQTTHFEAAQALSLGSLISAWEVKRVCMEDKEPLFPADLRDGLKRLVAHYG